MHDQANDLRRLVSRCAVAETLPCRRRPARVVVGGGKGGVGTTTIAVNLALAAAAAGQRTVLVDAEPRGGNIALLCGLQHRYTLADVLAQRRSVEGVLEEGPGGVRVLPGAWGLESICDYPLSATDRLVAELARLGPETDLVVLDAGSSPARMTARLCKAADLILLVTTTETTAIMDSYASIKTLAVGNVLPPIHTVVNSAPTAESAENVHQRLAKACRRFLGLHLQAAGYVSADPRMKEAGASGRPLVIAAPGCNVARQIRRLAKALAACVADGRASTNPSESRGLGKRKQSHKDVAICRPQTTANHQTRLKRKK